MAGGAIIFSSVIPQPEETPRRTRAGSRRRAILRRADRGSVGGRAAGPALRGPRGILRGDSATRTRPTMATMLSPARQKPATGPANATSTRGTTPLTSRWGIAKPPKPYKTASASNAKAAEGKTCPISWRSMDMKHTAAQMSALPKSREEPMISVAIQNAIVTRTGAPKSRKLH